MQDQKLKKCNRVWRAIELLMAERGIDKVQLANMVSVSPSAVSKWSKGGGIRPTYLAKIAKGFGVPVSDLLAVASGEKISLSEPKEDAVRETGPAYGSADRSLSAMEEKMNRIEAMLGELLQGGCGGIHALESRVSSIEQAVVRCMGNAQPGRNTPDAGVAGADGDMEHRNAG